MSKLHLSIAGALAALALSSATAAAAEPLLVLEDPTPDRSFSGTYLEHGRYHGDKHSGNEGYQDGYVAVYSDGAVACNGSEQNAVVDQDGDGDADPFQGYVWVGPSHAPAPGSDHVGVAGVNPEAPGGVAGGGSEHGKFSGRGTGEAPCEETDPEGDGEGR